MWPGPWFLVLSFSCGCLAQTLTQSRASITRTPGKKGIITCQVAGATVSNSDPLHWYQQKPGQPPTRILYFGDGIARDPGVGDSFKAGKVSNSEFHLVIEKLTHEQAATYYCAYWATSGTWRKIFGGGTRLIVTDKAPKPPNMYLFGPKSEDLESKDKFFVACLMTNFFPEVINVEWKIDGVVETQKKQLTDSVKKTKEGAYSLISRLEVSKVEWDGQKISCVAKHETPEKEISFDSSKAVVTTTVAPKVSVCPSSEQEPQKSADEGTPFSSLRVATLTYTILLMKSVLYCCIISLIVYKVEYRGTKKSL